MAVLGEAHIVVRAITNQVKDDIRRGFDGADREGGRAGDDAGKEYQKSFGRSLSRGKGMFSNIRQEALQASDAFARLVQVGYVLGPAIVALAGAIGGAVGGLFALGAQAAAAGPALLSLVNVFGALAQGAIVLKTVFSGVGAAIGAGMKPAGGAGRSAKDAAKAIEAAQDRLKNARKRLAQVIDSANEAEARDLERIADAEKRVEDARKNHTKAIEREAEAQQDALEAQEAITEARDEARESIQQLRFELEDAVLSEQRAALGLEDARNELAKVANLPPNNRQRREAELAFAEAELRLRRAKDKTSDTAEEVEEANQKGIEGSDEVVAALERQADAEKAHNEAKKDTQRALEAITEAEEGVVDATNEYNKALVENRARIKEAEEAVKDAEEALKDAKKGGDGAGGGVDKFAEAMSKLAPAAQEFVKFAIGVKKEFDGIKKAAQQEFFSKINDDIFELAENYLPILEDRIPKTASVLAGAGEKIIGVFNLPDNQNRVDRVLESNDKILGDVGEAIANLANSFLILLDNLRPLAEEFSGWIKTVTDGWNQTLIAKDKTGELSSTLEYSGGVVKTLGGIFGSLFRSIKNIGEAAAGPGSGGEKLLDLLKEVTQRWEDFTGSEEGQQRLENFFNNIVPLVSELGGLIGDIFKGIFKTTEDATSQEGGGPLTPFITSLREVVRILTDEMGPELMNALPIIGDALTNAAQAMANLTSSGAIEVFFQVIADFAELLKNITGNDLFLKIFAFVAPAFALSRGLSLIFKFLKFIFMGAILGPIFKFVGAFKSLAGFVPIIAGALGTTTGPFLLIVAAAAGLVAIFVAMWRESEIFREALKELVDKVIARATEMFNNLKEKIDKALEPLGGMEGAVDKLKAAFKFLGDIIGQYVLPFFEFGIMNAFAIIEGVIGTLIDFIGNLIDAFKTIFDGFKEGDIKKIFEGVVKFITAPFRALWPNLKKIFTDLIDNVINLVKNLFGISSPSKVFEDIGQALLDGISAAFEMLFDIFVQPFIDMWNKVTDFFETDVFPFITGLPDKFFEFLEGLWDGFIDFFENVWEDITGFLGPNGKVAKAIQQLPVDFANWLVGLWDGILEGFNIIWTEVSGFLGLDGKLGKTISGLPGKVATWLKDLWSPISNGLATAWEAAKKWWNTYVKGKGFTIDTGVLGGFSVPGIGTIPETISLTIPGLAKGGIVMPTGGGTIAMLAEAGKPERVEPLDPDGLSKRDKAMISYLTGGAGGTTINVYPAPGMDERELAEKVSRELAYMMRRGTL